MPFLGLWCSIKDGSAWPGTEEDFESPESGGEPSETVSQSLRSLAARIEPLVGKSWCAWEELVPLYPTITSDLALREIEISLIDTLPHLETLSHNPRSHLTIEEIREDVSRARRVSHRAVATLVSKPGSPRITHGSSRTAPSSGKGWRAIRCGLSHLVGWICSMPSHDV